MTVVQELDKSLFEGYVKPKVTLVTEIMRKGVLDPDMDWYETPRPSGALITVCFDALSYSSFLQRSGSICLKP